MQKVLLGAFIALVLVYGGCLAVLAGEADDAGTLTTADASCGELSSSSATDLG